MVRMVFRRPIENWGTLTKKAWGVGITFTIGAGRPEVVNPPNWTVAFQGCPVRMTRPLHVDRVCLYLEEKITMHIQTDQNWRVIGFPYHDGNIERICLEDGAAAPTLRIAIRGSSGELSEVHVTEIILLRIDELRQGNIVHNIRAIPVAAVVGVGDVWRLLKEKLCLEQEQLPAVGVVLVLESSYGAQILAVCKDIQVNAAA
jgi:hypothetical protein